MFTSLIALLLSAMATLLPTAPQHMAPAPALGGIRGPSSPSPAGRLSGGVSHLPQPTPAPPTVAAPTDVAEQLPTETDGRQVDCPDGVHVGVMADGTVTGCP